MLDSYGIPANKLQQNDCGSIYGIATAKANACKPPTVWQSYDIDFTARSSRTGRKSSTAGSRSS